MAATWVNVDRDILPLFVFEGVPAQPKAFVGTGFLVAPGILVTCWHVVRAELPDGQYYGAALKDSGDDRRVLRLSDVSQDSNGRDLATARVDAAPALSLPVAQTAVPLGTDVLTFGYPLTRVSRTMQGTPAFALAPRYLEGYISRTFNYEQPGFGLAPSYELDMLAPGGLSGAPLITRRSLLVNQSEIVGVVYSAVEAYSIAKEATVDADTGATSPEVIRLVSFALAHYTTSLRDLAGTATDERPLSDILDHSSNKGGGTSHGE